LSSDLAKPLRNLLKEFSFAFCKISAGRLNMSRVQLAFYEWMMGLEWVWEHDGEYLPE
jgi:hypothetical protein